VRRIRWFDPDKDDPSSPVEWSTASFVTATLFLNFTTAHAIGRLWVFCPLPLFAVLVAAIAVLQTCMFYIGPALAMRTAGRSLFQLLQDSLGTIPSYAIRFGAVVFLLAWMATLIGLPVRLLMINLEREPSSRLVAWIAAAVLILVFVTGRQSLQTRAGMAAFTNKLALAIFLAALIRVHEGWPALLGPFPADTDRGHLWYVWSGFSHLTFLLAPLSILAADLGRRASGTKAVVKVGLLGVALPVFLTVLLTGVIKTATHASGYYVPSLEPNLGMALWARAARSGWPARILIAGVTVFGALRFGSRSLMDAVPIRNPGRTVTWILLACSAGSVAWCSIYMFNTYDTGFFDWSARCLAATGAVITVDFMTGRRYSARPRKLDWVGTIAILTGMAASLYVPHGELIYTRFPWWYPWVLTSYVVSFLLSLGGRLIQRLLTGSPEFKPAS
jgi:hypothetical protein